MVAKLDSRTDFGSLVEPAVLNKLEMLWRDLTQRTIISSFQKVRLTLRPPRPPPRCGVTIVEGGNAHGPRKRGEDC